MKRFVSILMSLVLMLVVLGPTTAMAQETDEHHHYGNTESVKEVPVTIDMLQQAKEKGVVPKRASLISPSATCKHTYTSWETIKSWYDPAPSFGECYILVEYQMRYCSKCNESFAREKSTQLSHIWKGNSSSKTCTRCGLKSGEA